MGVTNETDLLVKAKSEVSLISAINKDPLLTNSNSVGGNMDFSNSGPYTLSKMKSSKPGLRTIKYHVSQNPFF